MNRAWRVVASGLCFVLFGAGTLLVSAVLLLVVRPAPFVSQARKARWVLWCLQRLSRGFVDMMALFGLMSYTVEGAERLRQPGYLIVSNHPSLIDALYLIGQTPGVCCIVKRELLESPFTGWLVRVAGYLSNDSTSLISDASSVLANGRSLLVFPEGTRNRDDLTLAFRRGAAHIAIESGAKILPVTIDFSPRSLQKGDPWYQIPARPSRVRIRALAPRDPVADARAALAGEPACTSAEAVPVTRLARHVTQRLRELYVDEARRFADPQGTVDEPNMGVA